MAKLTLKDYLSILTDRRLLIVTLLGFSSGLPLALTGSTLQAWLSDAKLDVSTIGLFALVGLPYTMKFLWAPILDRYALPYLGLRRGWGIVSQIGLALAICLLALIDPVARLDVFSLVAFVVAFFSASQDIVVDAYRTEVLDKETYGIGAGLATTGYRVATLVSGGLALIMADHMSWTLVYQIMAALALLGALVLFFSPEPRVARAPRETNFRDSVVGPFLEFFQRSGAMEILLFVLIYKLSTLMATALTTKYLLELGYSKTLIGAANKGAGLFASIAGTLIGGALMMRLGLKRSLWIFGVIQALVGLTFYALPHFAALEENLRNVSLFAIVSMDQFMMGLGTVAILGFMMSVVSLQFTGTQYALLSSLTAVSRVILVAHAGTIVEHIGWDAFFLGTVPLAIPGLLLLSRFDHWQTVSKVKSRLGLIDKFTVFIFVAALIALSSDPLWRWLDLKDLGADIVIAGAAGIVCVVLIGLLKPYVTPRASNSLRKG